MTNDNKDVVERAKAFAFEAHAAVKQKRKYTKDPYIVHPEAVADIVTYVGGTPVMIAAAWLHDTVEDTLVTIDDIYYYFGLEVGNLVLMLTDKSKPEDGNRKLRKEIDRQHLALASPEAKTIKLADLINNSKSIMKYDPMFAVTFLNEKRLLLEVLKEGNTLLWGVAYGIAHTKHYP